MTTNQTINIPRDLADKLALCAPGGIWPSGNPIDELRALLDAPASLWNPHPATASLAALLLVLAQHGIKATGGFEDQPWIIETAGQHQGENLGLNLPPGEYTFFNQGCPPETVRVVEQPAAVAEMTETRTPWEIRHDADPGDEAAFRKWRQDRLNTK